MKSAKKKILFSFTLFITLYWDVSGIAQAKGLNDYLHEGIQAYHAALYQDALNAWEAGLRLAEEQGDKAWQGAFLGTIGEMYRNLSLYEKALS